MVGQKVQQDVSMCGIPLEGTLARRCSHWRRGEVRAGEEEEELEVFLAVLLSWKSFGEHLGVTLSMTTLLRLLTETTYLAAFWS